MPQDVFKCRDGEVVLAVGNDGQFAKMCVALERPELASDPRYIKNADRVRNMHDLMALIAEIFAQWSRADLVDALEKAGVPVRTDQFDRGSVRAGADQASRDADGFAASDAPAPCRRSPIRSISAATPLHYDRAPPLLGQHSDEVLREARLIRRGD